ncbi:MAG: hypothetical protein JNL45_14775 [Hyphomicrobium sp.]|nr:hypothetical protein [Hyphomicrobium sp.]
MKHKWYAPDDASPQYPCPCCDYVTLPERGSFLICPICFWEDDGQDIQQLDLKSAPNNGLTLRQARMNFSEFGACDLRAKSHVIPEIERGRYARRVREGF